MILICLIKFYFLFNDMLIYGCIFFLKYKEVYIFIKMLIGYKNLFIWVLVFMINIIFNIFFFVLYLL